MKKTFLEPNSGNKHDSKDLEDNRAERYQISFFTKTSLSVMYTAPGLPEFSLSKHTKTGKIYQMITKRPYIIPYGRKILQMVIKYNNILHPKAL
jgi:hypothetical protein